METINKISKWLVPVLLVVIVMLCVMTCNTQRSLNVAEDNLMALNDTVTYYKDSRGRIIAQKSVLEVNNKVLMVINSKNDSMLLALQKWVKDHKGTSSATAVGISTSASGKGATIIRDTVFETIDSIVYAYPMYYYNNSDEHLGLWVQMDKDTTIWDVSFNDNLIVSHEYKKDGLFKRKYPVIKVTSANPYSSVTDIAAYRVPLKREFRVSIGPMVGYGISVPDFKPQAFIGVGVTYSVIKF